MMSTAQTHGQRIASILRHDIHNMLTGAHGFTFVLEKALKAGSYPRPFIENALTHLSAVRANQLRLEGMLGAVSSISPGNIERIKAQVCKMADAGKTTAESARAGVELGLNSLPEKKRASIIETVSDCFNPGLYESIKERTRLTSAEIIKQEFGLSNLVKSLLKGTTEKDSDAGRDGKATHVEIFADNVPIFGHEENLKIALMNLLRNAWQHQDAAKPEQKRVVRLKKEGREAVIEVEDNGTGMPEFIRQRLQHGAVISGRKGGTGLGTEHARQVVRDHGGTYEIESQEGIGTLFRIRIPIYKPYH